MKKLFSTLMLVLVALTVQAQILELLKKLKPAVSLLNLSPLIYISAYCDSTVPQCYLVSVRKHYISLQIIITMNFTC